MGNELLSLLENAGRMGIPLPQALTNAVEILGGKQKQEEKRRCSVMEIQKKLVDPSQVWYKVSVYNELNISLFTTTYNDAPAENESELHD